MKSDIKLSSLRETIRRELENRVSEGTVDHDSIKRITATASTLYKTIEAFESKLKASSDTPGFANFSSMITPMVEQLKAKLEDMLRNPSAYVTKQKRTIVVKKPEAPKLV